MRIFGKADIKPGLAFIITVILIVFVAVLIIRYLLTTQGAIFRWG